MMHDVVIPYFKKYFDASEYRSYLSFAEEDASVSSAPKMAMPSMMAPGKASMSGMIAECMYCEGVGR